MDAARADWDDNHDAADSMAMLISMDDYEVQTVYEGRVAATAAETFRPDVALLDIGMPDLDGYAIARAIRRQRSGGSAYLIALTGWGQQEDKRRAFEAAFDTHLTKPVDPQQLREFLRKRVQTAPADRTGSNE